MLLNIYSIKDKLADYGPIFTAETNDLAKRSYLEIIKSNPFRKDLDLYKLGTYNTENGLITDINGQIALGSREPEKLMEGEVYGTGEVEV